MECLIQKLDNDLGIKGGEVMNCHLLVFPSFLFSNKEQNFKH